jgi:hypothetical protein
MSENMTRFYLGFCACMACCVYVLFLAGCSVIFLGITDGVLIVLAIVVTRLYEQGKTIPRPHQPPEGE